MKTQSGLLVCLGTAIAMSCMTVHADPSLDKAITNQVKSALSSNPDVGTEINVMTKNGIVYLKGKTATQLAKSHAEALAKAVPGVQIVVNDIGADNK